MYTNQSEQFLLHPSPKKQGHSIRGYILCLCIGALSFACKNNQPVPTINSQGLQSRQELEDLRNERNELIDELTALKLSKTQEVTTLSTERERLVNEKALVDEQIAVLRDELAATEANNEEQRKQLMDELAEAQATKDTLQTMLDENKEELEKALLEIERLDNEVKALNTKIDQMQERINRLEAELAAEKARNAANQSTGNPNADTATTDTANNQTSDQSQYIFRYAAGNDCLSVPDASVNNGIQIKASPCNTAARHQHFAAPNAANQIFFIIKARHSAKCLAIDTADKDTENAAVKQASCDLTADEHYWEFYVRGDKDFRLKNKASGKCMKIRSDGFIIQGDCDQNFTFFNWLSVQ